MDSTRFKPVAVLLGAMLFVAPAMVGAGVIRHDRSQGLYTTLAADPRYEAVGKMLSNTQVRGSGTLIHPRWVLTAAHVGYVSGDSRTFMLDDGQSRPVTSIRNHTNWVGGQSQDGWDLSLHKLGMPLSGVALPALYSGSSELGKTATSVGYGTSGDGETGANPFNFPPGTKRAGTNILDQAGYTDGTGQSQIVFSPNLLFIDFDRPGSPTHSMLGSPNTTDLEYMIAGRDSGGGVFIEENNQTFLAAVLSLGLSFDPDGDNGISSDYGDLSASTRISVAQTMDWIEVILPTLGDLNDNGTIDSGDIDLFVIALTKANDEAAFLSQVGVNQRFYAADLTLDGLVDNLDIPPMVDLLEQNGFSPQQLNAQITALPEPAGGVVLAILFGWLWQRDRPVRRPAA